MWHNVYMNDLVTTLDEDLEYVEHELFKETLVMRVRSTRASVRCPYCGMECSRVHSRHTRRFWDLPVMGHHCIIELEHRKMLCSNPACSHKTFTEPFVELPPYARRTKRLNDKIIDIVLDMSSVSATQQLRNGVCPIGKSTICREIQKRSIEPEKDRYTHIGIDDFAIRRGHTYGTCMVDQTTHAVIDMVPTRDLNEVADWLKSWTNLELVTRDGSSTYRAAITCAHPSCIQVADRFHLVKNVLEGAEKTIQGMLPRKIVLSDCKSADGEAAEDKAESLSVTEPMTESECRRLERAEEARKLHRAGMSNLQIARYLGLDPKTVRKYCDEAFTPRFCSGRKRPSMLDNFRDAAAQMVSEGKRGTEIHKALRQLGYAGSYSTVQKFVKARREANPAVRALKSSDRAIEREHLVSLVYKRIAEIPGLTTNDLVEVLERFPALWGVYQCIDSFRYTLFFGTPNELADWVSQTADSPYPKLVSAAEGVRRDLAAAMNAVESRYSNGVVEGSNTKIKLAKRIMYGRCSFNTLRTKVLLKEQRRRRTA